MIFQCGSPALATSSSIANDAAVAPSTSRTDAPAPTSESGDRFAFATQIASETFAAAAALRAREATSFPADRQAGGALATSIAGAGGDDCLSFVRGAGSSTGAGAGLSVGGVGCCSEAGLAG